MAQRANNTELMALLLQNGADPAERNDCNQTALPASHPGLSVNKTRTKKIF
ncbi:ankyrin repeat domain-containing protein [Acinetobacter baumannii]